MLTDRILKKLEHPEKEPIRFIKKHASGKNPETLNLLRDVFREMTKKNGTNNFLNNGLTDIYIDNFDSEQIWQQIELKNQSLIKYIPKISEILLSMDKLNFPLKDYHVDNIDQNKKTIDEEEESDSDDDARSQSDNEDSEEESDEEEDTLGKEKKISGNKDSLSENEDSSDSSEAHSEEEEEEEERAAKEKIYPKKSSIVDDNFFNLHEMEVFLEKEENKETESEKDDDLDIDFFEDLPEDEDENEINYDDFFENSEPSQEKKKLAHKKRRNNEETEQGEDRKKVRFSFNENNSDEGCDEEPQEKSSLQIRQSKLKQKMQKLEDEALSEKPWQLRGEIDASKRPVNSLLEEVVEYDITQRPAPVITEEVNQTLESIIVNRIKDAAYDDVVRKMKPVKVPNEFKKELVLNQEKSKFSLAEIYEQEYLKQKQKEDIQDEEVGKNEMTEEKKQIVKMMDVLFRKLDTLSNFHYTPKPASADIQIVSNAPAITMEEATPAAVSDANLLAPQEIAGKIKRPLQSKDERTSTDKKRERRKKKSFQGKKFKREASKKNTGDNVKSLLKSRHINLAEQEKVDSTFKSSSKFFSQLQDEVNRDSQGPRRPQQREKKSFSAKQLKL